MNRFIIVLKMFYRYFGSKWVENEFLDKNNLGPNFLGKIRRHVAFIFKKIRMDNILSTLSAE